MNDPILLPTAHVSVDRMQRRARHFRDILTGDREGDFNALFGFLPAQLGQTLDRKGDALLDALRCNLNNLFLQLADPRAAWLRQSRDSHR